MRSRNNSGTEKTEKPEARVIHLKERIRDSDATVTSSEAASYIHDLAKELKAIAESAHLKFLAHLLALVVEESAAQRRSRL